MDNKKAQTELKATNIISLFHPKKKKKIIIFFVWVKQAGRHFGFLKKAGRHQKGAGRRALQKRPRQNTVHVDATIMRYFQTELFSSFLPPTYAAHISLVAGRPWSCMPKWQYGDLVDFTTVRV